MFTSTSLVTSLLLSTAFAAAPPVQTPLESSLPVGVGTEASTSAPSLRFDPAILDLGEMTVGQTGSGKVTVTNTSDKPIKVARIVPACGCTKASAAPVEMVEPGASFVVEFSLDAGKRPGVQLKRKVAFHIAEAGVESFELNATVKQDASQEQDKTFVSLIRLKPATEEAAGGRASAERSQDSAILAIDAALERAGERSGIRMKLHRESGALFVHGTAVQIELAERTMDDRGFGQ